MSAPDTNVDKQTRRHKAPLVGMVLAIIVVGVLVFAFLGRSADDNVEPGSAAPATVGTDGN